MTAAPEERKNDEVIPSSNMACPVRIPTHYDPRASHSRKTDQIPPAFKPTLSAAFRSSFGTVRLALEFVLSATGTPQRLFILVRIDRCGKDERVDPTASP